jgi:outer membrane protein OmpA-like peptidoglycan-associated protein
MKHFSSVILILILAGPASAQNKPQPFTLSDTAFTVGSYFRTELHIDPDNRHIRDYHQARFDSIADFMKAHPELVFAIESYTDQRGSDSGNMNLSQRRASFIKRKLTEKGVSQYNLTAVGMGEGNPVVVQSKIDAEKDKNKQEELYAKNRRYEFRIVYICKSFLQIQSPPGKPEAH